MTVLDRELSNRVTAEMPTVPDVHVGRLIVTVIAALFYVLGFTAARIVRMTVFIAMWVFTAVRLGWQEGLAKPVPRTS